MMVAASIQMSVAAQEEARLGVLFRIQADDLRAVSAHQREKSNIVLLFHGMVERHIPFRFDTFRMDAMRVILRLGFERRQCHTTAGVRAFADRPDDIAANRADIEMALLQVRRAVAVFDMFPGKQLCYGY